jgi:hypothetical protein
MHIKIENSWGLEHSRFAASSSSVVFAKQKRIKWWSFRFHKS